VLLCLYGWVGYLLRTACSLMTRAGVDADHAERCLGHVIGGVRGVYDRHAYAEGEARCFRSPGGAQRCAASARQGGLSRTRGGRFDADPLRRAPDRIGSHIAAAMGDVKPTGEGANLVRLPRGKAAR
jgi:hypothetical protein